MSEQAEHVYDVFISYSQADQSWVLNKLLPKLEQAGISYIEELHFELGCPKLDEIERAIKESRRTLLVLTPSYLKDTWGEFAELLASSYGRKRGMWQVIPAIKEPCELPERLSPLVSVNFHDFHLTDEYFWQRLITALSSPLLLSSSRQNEYYSYSARKGFDALTHLMSEAKVRDAVVAFRTDFQAVCKQIEVVGNYKDLHDQLHKLELECYGVIVQEAKQLPNDEIAWDNLDIYEVKLQDNLTEVREAAIRAALATDETIWIKYLEQATKELGGAIKNHDLRQLDKAVKLINRALTSRPSQINTRLNQEASALRLPALVNAMTCVRNKLADSELNPEKASHFKDGVEALVELHDSLTGLVKNHDAWQELDSELRRIEASIGEQTISELELSWSFLKQRAEKLYSSSIDKWARLFKEDSENLDSAIAARNPAETKKYFRRYRHRASNRFYEVDKELKQLCDNLRLVGEPLASVLRMIEE